MVLQAERTTIPSPVEPTAGDDVASDSVVVSFWTMVSRITGLARLAAIAAVLGATFMGNTFQAANLLPNAVYEFLTGSLLVNVLVPHLVRYARASDRRSLERIAGRFLGIVVVAFAAVVVVLCAGRGLLVHGFAAAVRDHTTAAAEVRAGELLLLLVLPQIVLYAVAGTAGAVLNATGRFALAAAGPAVENVGTIATIVVAAVLYGTGVDVRSAPHAFLVLLGAGATAAVALHALLLWAGCARAGVVLRPRIDTADQEVRAVLRDLVPTIGQAGLNAVRSLATLVAGNVVAGGVVAFQFAMTFFYLPPAVSARAVGVALLRRLSIVHGDGDEASFKREFAHGIALTAFVTIPCAVAFGVLATPLVRGFSFGAMATTRSIVLAATALIALAPGVVGESAYLLGTYAGYARGDARSPFRSALLRTGISVAGMALAAVYAHGDRVIFLLGAAVTVGNIVGSIDLARRLRTHLPHFAELRRSMAAIAFDSVVLAVVAIVVLRIVETIAHVPYEHTVSIVIACAAGGAAYLAFERRRGSTAFEALAGGLRDRSRRIHNHQVQRARGPVRLRGRGHRDEDFRAPKRPAGAFAGWTTTKKVRGAALLVAMIAAPIAVLSPARGIAAVFAAALAGAVAVYPPLAAYVMLAATPIVVGINRGSALPMLRPHEALVLLLGMVLLARQLVIWARRGWPTRVRLPAIDVSIALLVLTASILPIVWMFARGQSLTRDDVLYALVIWKYAGTYLIVRSAVRTADDVRRALMLSIGAACVVAIVGILQALKLFGVPNLLMHLYAPDGMTDLVSNNRATSTIGNSIAMADVMVIHLGIVVAWMIRTKRHRVVLAGCAVLFCLGALASGQTSGVIGLVVALGAIAYLTGHVKQLVAAGAVVGVAAAIMLQPVVHQRLSNIDPSSHLPQSWVSRGENLKEYFLPPLASPANDLLGVRPAGRLPSKEPWRDWVYIESGFVWLLWTGGIPLVLAFIFFIRRGMRETRLLARARAGPVGVAATGGFVALAVIAVLMAFDPHLTMRGTADLTFALLGLCLAGVAERFVARRALVRRQGAPRRAATTGRICLVRHRHYEPMLRKEAEALRAAGHRVHVVCMREPGHRMVERDNGVTVVRLPLSRERAGIVRYVFDYAAFFVATASVLAFLDLTGHYDVVQVCTMPDFLVFAAFVPRMRGSKIVAYMQEPTPELSQLTLGSRVPRRIFARIEQAAIAYADIAITVTEQLKARYVSRGADGSKIHVVLNGPDPKHMIAHGTRTPGLFTVLCHGSIEDRYGHDVLLRAAAIARRELPELRVAIAGEGSGAERVRALIAELELDGCVEFLGYLPFSELCERIASADLGIVAMRDTEYANLIHTNKMFDFIIASTPVLATRLDAVAAYFPDDAIAFVPPEDAEAMARAIVGLARDPVRREALATRARELYAIYGWDAQREIYLDAIASVMA